MRFEGMKAGKDRNFKHDVEVQAHLAEIIYRKEFADAPHDKTTKNQALYRWATGKEHECLSDYYRDVLREMRLESEDVDLEDGDTLNSIAEAVLEMQRKRQEGLSIH